MPTCRKLSYGKYSTQDESQSSFLGGRPHLPGATDIPKCELCGVEQTFFFQVGFPVEHTWAGLSLAVFSCTACADKNHLIPEMLDAPLRGASITKEYLKEYQNNFKFIVFETKEGTVKSDYSKKIAYRPIALRPSEDDNFVGSKLGGSPSWLLEDESPGNYDNSYELIFLLQIHEDTEFNIIEGAPKQMEISLRGNPELSPFPYYQLFNGNRIFLFGSIDHKSPAVYALTQI